MTTVDLGSPLQLPLSAHAAAHQEHTARHSSSGQVHPQALPPRHGPRGGWNLLPRGNRSLTRHASGDPQTDTSSLLTTHDSHPRPPPRCSPVSSPYRPPHPAIHFPASSPATMDAPEPDTPFSAVTAQTTKFGRVRRHQPKSRWKWSSRSIVHACQLLFLVGAAQLPRAHF